MRITLKQLEIFVAVAKIENISKAAESLFLTQSACSMALTAFENQLGGELFERRGKKLILNDIGRALFHKASNILAAAQELEQSISTIKGNTLHGQLTIGASTTIGNYLLPKVISAFITENTMVKCTLQIFNTERIISDILKFNIDIGFIEGDCHHKQITVTPWQADQLIIISAPQHPLSKTANITKNDLLKAQWILREQGSGTRQKFIAAMDHAIEPFLELGHTEAIKQAVIQGIGLSCVSRATVASALNNGELCEIKAPFLKLTRHFYLLRHKDKHHSAACDAFFDFCMN